MAAAVCAHGGVLKLFPSRRLFSGAARPPLPPPRIIVCSEFLSRTVRPIPPPRPSINHSKDAWNRERLMLEEMKLQRRTESNNTQPPMENDVNGHSHSSTPTATGNLEKRKYDPVREQEEQEEKIRKPKGQEEKIRKLKEQEEIRKLKEQEKIRKLEEQEEIRKLKEQEKIRKLKEQEKIRKLKAQEEKTRKPKGQEEKIRKLKEQEEIRKLKEQEEEIRKLKEQEEEIRKLKEQEEKIRKLKAQEEKIRKLKEQEEIRKLKEQEKIRKLEEQEEIRKLKEQEKIRKLKEQEEKIRKPKGQEEKIRKLKEQEEIRKLKEQEEEIRKLKEQEETIRKLKAQEEIRKLKEQEEEIRKLKEQEEKIRKLKEQEDQEEKIRKLKAQEEKSRRRKEQEEDIRKQDENIRKHKEDLKSHIYDKVLIVDNVETAKAVVLSLTTEYKDLTFACDTEVADIDVKQDTPVDHGKITCFSIYGGEGADFGEKKSRIWVDVLDGEKGVLLEFKPFFEDPDIKKVWHNYSFDSHVIENYGIKLSGFHADTMHLARLWDSSRQIEGGYSLEALTRDPKVMLRESLKNGADSAENVSPAANISVGLMNTKVSMKSIFGKKKLRADGSQGKLTTLAPVEMLQRGEERVPWICYSVLDSICTWMLFESLKEKLEGMQWRLHEKRSMYDFYEEYWRPFGVLLVKMESEGMLVDKNYLSNIEKVANEQQKIATARFREWASKKCPDAEYMNVGSDIQLRQLFFGGTVNRKDPSDILPETRKFTVASTNNVDEKGKKIRTIELSKIKDMGELETDKYTLSGWPSLRGDALKSFAGKIPTAEIFLTDSESELGSPCITVTSDKDYGTAFKAFEDKKAGRDACHAIAALCEVCSIDSLISNFIRPLQEDHISGKDGRIHCSLNINTETGRLSARRPNLQNQPALEKDRYKIRQAFIAKDGNSLVVADYGQLELRLLAHLANCQSMLKAFKAGGDFHSRTAVNMYEHVNKALADGKVLLEWHPRLGEDKPPVPLLKDVYASERRKAKMLNFSIAYGKTPHGLARDWKVDIEEAKKTVELWYKERQEVLSWQKDRKREALTQHYVTTLLGRRRQFQSLTYANNSLKGHIERAAINTPVQGSAADVAMCAMLEIDRNEELKELGWKLLLQVHDEVILEGPTDSSERAKEIVVECMSKPFNGENILNVDLSVDAKCAQNWYEAK